MFLGSDYISNNIREIIIKHFNDLDEETKLNELKEKIKFIPNKYNPFGLYPKIRTDFLSRNDFVFGNESKLSIFEFSEKMKWKDNVISFLRGLENEK